MHVIHLSLPLTPVQGRKSHRSHSRPASQSSRPTAQATPQHESLQVSGSLTRARSTLFKGGDSQRSTAHATPVLQLITCTLARSAAAKGRRTRSCDPRALLSIQQSRQLFSVVLLLAHTHSMASRIPRWRPSTLLCALLAVIVPVSALSNAYCSPQNTDSSGVLACKSHIMQ